MRTNHALNLLLIFLTLAIIQGMQIHAASLNKFIGIIKDAETKEPIENVKIILQELKSEYLTDKNGRFEIVDLLKGSYNARIYRLGYRTESRKLTVTSDSAHEHIFFIVPMGVQGPSVIVTGTHYRTEFQDLIEESHYLTGRELQQTLGQTLAATLRNETGLAVRSMGPAPSRPVIRGLGGNRVVIEEDGLLSTDLSASSPDHAVAIESFTAEKVELIRGPKILLHSQSTIGGVVNVVNNDIPQNIPERYSIDATSYFESANSGYLGALSVSLPLSVAVFKGRLSHKNTSNISSPIGELNNTSAQTNSFNIGSSIVMDSWLAGASYSGYETSYGIPGGFVGSHPKGVKIEMLRRSLNAESILHLHSEQFENLELNFARTYYEHTEFESSGAIGAQFAIRDYLVNARLNHLNFIGLHHGAFGFTYNYKDTRMGGYVFTPASTANSISLYAYEDWEIDKFYLQAALRYGFESYQPEKQNSNSEIGNIIPRDFNMISAAFSILSQISDDLYLGFDLSRTVRPPTLEELYSEGPHLAAYSFEIGNPELQSEKGIGFELYSFYKNTETYAMINLFLNEMESYIIPRNNGRINPQLLLPIYVAMGERARIYGIETEITHKLDNNFSVNWNLSYTVGELINNASPLPMIPPLKSILELRYKESSLNLAIRAEYAGAQHRVDTFEEPTDAYLIFGFSALYSFDFFDSINNISLNIENLTNSTYRNHLSRIKSIMPEPGINARIVYKLYI